MLKARFARAIQECDIISVKAKYEEDVKLLDDVLKGVEVSSLAQMAMVWAAPVASRKIFFSSSAMPTNGKENCGVHAINKAWDSAKGDKYDPSALSSAARVEDTRKLVKSALVSMAHDSVLSSLGESERARLHAESVSSCESKQPINSVAIHAAGVLREIKIGIAYRSSDWIEWVGDVPPRFASSSMITASGPRTEVSFPMITSTCWTSPWRMVPCKPCLKKVSMHAS